MNESTEMQNARRPLTAWELRTLLEPMHQYRRTQEKGGRERKHFLSILSFVYRNRYVLASQIQQRFGNIMRSDRTTRRHLAEMESLGYLGVVATRSVSPLWPKVYHVTQRGAARLRKELATKGKPGHVIRLDRSRHAGYSADHVLHEVWTTQFLLEVWGATRATEGFEVLKMERRSMVTNPAFRVSIHGRLTRLIPDAMFLYRYAGKGMMCVFLEIDTGTMSLRQMEEKFRRYDAFARSPAGRQYVCQLYRCHGATQPRPVFRIFLVTGDRADPRRDSKRMDRLMRSLTDYRTTLASTHTMTVTDLLGGTSTVSMRLTQRT